MKRRNFLSLFPALAAGSLAGALASRAQAELTIEISGAGANRIPIAIAAFSGESALPRGLTDVIRDDLDRCGYFRRVSTGALPMEENATPDWSDWKDKGADVLVTGTVTRRGDGRFEVRFRMHDITRQSSALGQIFTFDAPAGRAVAHRVADVIYEKLLGTAGIFATRIAYIEKVGTQYRLMVSDADGFNQAAVQQTNEPMISPAWSPDGSRIAYVSFESKKPIIYVRELNSTKITVLANFKGSNSAPAWSPNGRQLAIVLTKDGTSQLYTINADGTGIRRLASSSGIDTEPSYSADGQWIYFTSDRGGAPQIYKISANGGTAQRVTFEGSYNVSARLSPDGKSLAYISRNSGRFQLTIMDLASGQTQVLTDSSKDESPSFSPNGRYLVYATELGGRGVLSVVSTDGKTKYRLSQQGGNIREPAWGPLVK